MMTRSRPWSRVTRASAPRISPSAPSPWTRVGTTSSSATGQRLERTFDRLAAAVSLRVERDGHRLSAVSGRLDALSPLKILERGYSLARDADGRVLKRMAQFPPGRTFRLRVSDGEVPARVVAS